MRARHDKIFDMEYIFIPIHQGNHYTCTVIYMKERRVKYYDSLVSIYTIKDLSVVVGVVGVGVYHK